MKVDFHVHLEEGPYTLQWLNRTVDSLLPSLGADAAEQGSREWADAIIRRLGDRLRHGPYSREWLDLYRAKAKQAGLRMVAIVEHLYRFWEYQNLYERNLHLGKDSVGQSQLQWLQQVASDSLPDFVTFLEEEKQRWAEDGIELKIGIDLDYFPGEEGMLAEVIGAYPWDVCIGGVHFIQGWGIYLPGARERVDRLDMHSLCCRYFDLVEQAIESRLFDLISHVDGQKAFGDRFDETALLPYYQRVARALKRCDGAAQIHTGQPPSTSLKEPHSRLGMLEIMAQHDVAVTTASGAHFPDQVGRHVAETQLQLKRAGIHEIAVYHKRQRQMVPL